MCEDEGQNANEDMDQNEIDILLDQYLRLREDMTTHIRIHNQRILSGIASLGAIVGYALVAESLWLIALVPIVLGLIFIQSSISLRYIASMSSVSVKIENRLSVVAPLFPWEGKYGGLYGEEPKSLRNSPSSIISWDDVLKSSGGLIAGAAYFIFLYLSFKVWPKRPPILSSFHDIFLIVIYALLTILMILAWLISLKFVREVDPTS